MRFSRPQIPAIAERLDAATDRTGAGVVIGFVDAGFHAHPDLLQPTRRLAAYVDVTQDAPPKEELFVPRPASWHGTMTACMAAGSGWLSGGRYRGLASEAEVVLIKAGDLDGRISGRAVARAIRFPLEHPGLGIRILSVSVGVRPSDPDAVDVERAVAEATAAGIVVFVAAGNDPGSPPRPPASAADAITVGGENDEETRSNDDDQLWGSSWGRLPDGRTKPDLLAPACTLPAPMLPGTLVHREAAPLYQLLDILEEWMAEIEFREGKAPDPKKPTDASLLELLPIVRQRIEVMKYVSTNYQHVEGTSFAAPIVASVAAQMLEADPALAPDDVRRILLATARPLAGVEAARQGAGVVQPRAAVEAVSGKKRRTTRGRRGAGES